MPFPRSSGILLHVTSLPGPHGSGDLGPDTYRFVDWLAAAGQRLWQVLPLGGIGPGNSPYMSTSAFAGNPLLIDLDEMASHGWLGEGDPPAAPAFPAGRVDYGTMAGFRMARLRFAAERFLGAADDPLRADFAEFCLREQAWLEDYALFMTLAERHPGKDWVAWDRPLARRDPAALRVAAFAERREIALWKFAQWTFFRQWLALKRHANARGVAVVGDVPIFVAYQSADVWARQDLFLLDDEGRPTVTAGVPPDAFSATGQRWGNPLYRWDAHEREGFAWWVERLRQATTLVDLVRIDHFRGFAGYWEIPASEPTAVRGRWAPGPGPKLFAAVRSALGALPVVAEDLGVVTADVVALREAFGLPGMRVLQFAFGGDPESPHLPHNYVRNTVVYTGTHDNDTTLGWWRAAPERERAFAAKYLGTDGREIHWDLIRAASQSVADVAVAPLQDVLGLGGEARMNLPGRAWGNWEWRVAPGQLGPDLAARLYETSAVHGRCAPDRLILPPAPEPRAPA